MGIDLGRFRSKKDDDEWLDWLADDPVPASVRSRMRAKAVRDASRPTVRRVGQQSRASSPEQPQNAQKADKKNHAVSINISIPKIKKPGLPAWVTPKKAAGAAILGVVVVIGVILMNTIEPGKKKPDDPKGVLSASSQKPDFAYSLPKGKESEAEGDVKYDAGKKVVNFRDSIGGVVITVSQQPLPEGLKEDTDNKVKKLAEDFAAKEVLSTANPTAYLGTSEKGPQTVIFAKNNLLVFIKSAKKIDNHDWAEYITNLK